LFAVFLLLGLGLAQTLVGTVGAAATALALDPAISLPRGSFHAGGLTPALAERVGDAAAWRDFEVYLLKGAVSGLGDAALAQLRAGFLAAGYAEVEEKTVRVGPERRVRYVFSGPAGRMLLFAVKTPGQFVYLVARARP
jgi:hypothetical protein